MNCTWFDLQVHECFPFSVAVTWKGAAPDSQNGAVDNQQSTIVFPKGNVIPSFKALTFYRSGTFSIDVHYTDVSELQAPPKISTYTVRKQHTEFNNLHLDRSCGMVFIASANASLYWPDTDWSFPVYKK